MIQKNINTCQKTVIDLRGVVWCNSKGIYICIYKYIHVHKGSINIKKFTRMHVERYMAIRRSLLFFREEEFVLEISNAADKD